MSGASQIQAGEQDPLAFTKMAGAGNDFVVIDNRSGRLGDVRDVTRRLCTRRLSAGADGLILIEPSGRATFRMRYYNADGSLGEFCGNGTRCAARFATLRGIAGESMTIETDAGIVTASIGADGRVTISLPPPQSYRAQRPLTVGPETIEGISIVVGVPHYVTFVDDDLWDHPVERIGRAIRQHAEMQPAGTNVNFVSVRDERSIEVRTYERGVEAETLACGSGVVASVAAGVLSGRVRPPVSVLTRSGIHLDVAMENSGGELREIRLTGDARVIYEAAILPETLEGFDPDFVREPAASRVLAP
ncbi:MAG TPA: diaminopimelate epimerase [Thermoanaerobaculia bacterium]|nr:diaminopimelate epimerase [Thermoanaerobaculia bacterium]